VDVEPIAEGLWRWTARHPDWNPQDDWDAEVGCVYYEDAEAVVLIDPLVPAGDEERFWLALDRDVERLATPVAVLVTSAWHARSADVVVGRYGATRELPGGVESWPTPPEAEVAFWIPAHACLVVGDALIGTADGLRIEPPSWVNGPYDQLLGAVKRLCALPVERVLTSHGRPVLTGGHAQLERAIAHAQNACATDR
jgi:hypothetical protein